MRSISILYGFVSAEVHFVYFSGQIEAAKMQRGIEKNAYFYPRIFFSFRKSAFVVILRSEKR